MCVLNPDFNRYFKSFFIFVWQTTNTEMFWVISEICSEHNITKRVKLLKYFIKVASKLLTRPHYQLLSLSGKIYPFLFYCQEKLQVFCYGPLTRLSSFLSMYIPFLGAVFSIALYFLSQVMVLLFRSFSFQNFAKDSKIITPCTPSSGMLLDYKTALRTKRRFVQNDFFF